MIAKSLNAIAGRRAAVVRGIAGIGANSRANRNRRIGRAIGGPPRIEVNPQRLALPALRQLATSCNTGRADACCSRKSIAGGSAADRARLPMRTLPPPPAGNSPTAARDREPFRRDAATNRNQARVRGASP